LVLWLVLAATLVFLSLTARRGPGQQGRLGWVVAVAALVGVALAARFGPRFLAVVAPTLGWLAWSWFRGKLSARAAPPPFEAPPSRGAMTREEALRVLGLREGASRDAIIDAHRSLIKKVHPDHGGSDHLAQQVNEAKRILQSGA
jgi:DnaJ-domain-containing protein 1